MSPLSSVAPALLAACLALAVGAAHIRFMEGNSLSPLNYGGQNSYEIHDWARIKHSGPHVTRASVGGRVELDCEANGSPPPSVQWYHNGNMVSEALDENNSVGGLRLGNVKSRLVLDCISPHHQGSYTCVAVSGTETVVSQPSVVFVQANSTAGMMPSCRQSRPPRIVTWSPNMMETMGNDVIMPCVSVGNPQPRVYWIDGQNNLISSGSDMENNDRYKVLSSGDLMISSVRWADMGHFTCVAESPVGRDTVTTFLYPMSKDR